MRQETADVVIVGSGISGVLVARALLRAGRNVTMLERGGLKTHAEQLRTGTHATGDPGSRHVHQIAEGSPDYPWNYVFGVGGSSLHWTGVTPRFVESDFRMRSEYGVMRDWPLALEDLLPHYRVAERLLGVAGAPDGDGRLPPHPYSPMDEALREPLAPYLPLPQARPSRAVGRRPPCCGSGSCELCPVDSRFSVLNGLGDVLEHPRLSLETGAVVERLIRAPGGRRVTGVRVLRAQGEPSEVRARTVVLAAGGFENPAILLRSELDRPAVGRHLYDHAHRTLVVRVRRDVGGGVGVSLATGMTDLFRDGAFRSRHAGAVVTPYNPGMPPQGPVTEALLEGRSGREVHRRFIEARRRTVVLDGLLEDVPRPERRLTLSGDRDEFGLPKLRVTYPPPSRYELAGWDVARDEIVRRLRPLGVQSSQDAPGPAGSHLLGTCRMGDDRDGVVDADQRHLDLDNLYVTGGSSFPTYTPAHPTLTISALALRLGEHLAREAT